MKKIILALIFTLLPKFLLSDIVRYQDGRVLENVKVNVGKETVEILFENGKREVRKKADLKKIKIKLQAVTWNLEKKKDNKQKELSKNKKTEETNENGEKENEEETAAKEKEDLRKKLENEFANLEKQRELNFPIPTQILEERKMHEPIMKERVRLQFTEGLLAYSGGQLIYSEIMQQNSDRYYVKNQFGLFYFTAADLGDSMVIETDNGKEEIAISKILGVKEEKYINGYVYLKGGEKFPGKILKNLGDQTLVSRNSKEIKINSSDILFPKISKEKTTTTKMDIKEGDKGKFLFTNGESIDGKLLKLSANYLYIETTYGVLEMELSNFVSVSKGDESK